MTETCVNGFWARSKADGKVYLYEKFTGRWWVLPDGYMLRVKDLSHDVAELEPEGK